MSATKTHLAPEYFGEIYDRDPDPWGFETRWYEQRKYALTIASLPRQMYTRAFEPGCSHGVLTMQLATRCASLVAAEIVPTVAARARERLGAFSHVEVRSLAIPDEWPSGTFDLVVLSEVAYYLSAHGLTQLLAHVDRSLEVGGHLVAVHWTGETDYPQTGAAVHARLDAHRALRRVVFHQESQFLLAVYERTEVTS